MLYACIRCRVSSRAPKTVAAARHAAERTWAPHPVDAAGAFRPLGGRAFGSAGRRPPTPPSFSKSPLSPARNRVLAFGIGGGYHPVHPPRRFGGWVQAPAPAGALRFLSAARLEDRAVAVADHRRQLGPSRGARPDLLEERAPEPLGPVPLRVRARDPRIPCAWRLSLFCLTNNLYIAP